MLDIGGFTNRHDRRAFLKVGGLTLGGLTLPQLLETKVRAAQESLPISDRSVVFVFMHGGPSQNETFDPKMTAPPGNCSVNGEVATSIPGVTYGYTFPRLAALAHKTTIVRSFRTGDGNHDIKPIVGRATYGANLGSLYARVAGANRPGSGMPTHPGRLSPASGFDNAMPISVMPYRSSNVWPLISRHRSSVFTGNAAEPDIMSRSPRTASERCLRTSGAAASHDVISRL